VVVGSDDGDDADQRGVLLVLLTRHLADEDLRGVQGVLVLLHEVVGRLEEDLGLGEGSGGLGVLALSSDQVLLGHRQDGLCASEVRLGIRELGARRREHRGRLLDQGLRCSSPLSSSRLLGREGVDVCLGRRSCGVLASDLVSVGVADRAGRCPRRKRGDSERHSGESNA